MSDDDTIFEEDGGRKSFKNIQMKDFNRMVSALTRDGSTPEDIVEELSDYRIDGHLTIDRAMILPVYQDAKSNPNTPMTSQKMRENVWNDIEQPMMEQQNPSQFRQSVSSALNESSFERELELLQRKIIERTDKGDYEMAQFYKDRMDEKVELRRNLLSPRRRRDDDNGGGGPWGLLATVLQKSLPDSTSELQKLAAMKDLFGGDNSPWHPNSGIAAMQIAMPEVTKLNETVREGLGLRRDSKEMRKGKEDHEELVRDAEQIKSQYTACPSCTYVIPKSAKQCAACRTVFEDDVFMTDPSKRIISQPPQQRLPPPQMRQHPQRYGYYEDEDYYEEEEDEYDDEEEDDELDERIEWFLTSILPRMSQMIEDERDPLKLSDSVWEFANDEEKEFLLFFSNRGVDEILDYTKPHIREFEEDYPDLRGNHNFVSQNRGWVQEVFDELQRLAESSDYYIPRNKYNELEGIWEDMDLRGRRRNAPQSPIVARRNAPSPPPPRRGPPTYRRPPPMPIGRVADFPEPQVPQPGELRSQVKEKDMQVQFQPPMEMQFSVSTCPVCQAQIQINEFDAHYRQCLMNYQSQVSQPKSQPKKKSRRKKNDE